MTSTYVGDYVNAKYTFKEFGYMSIWLNLLPNVKNRKQFKTTSVSMGERKDCITFPTTPLKPDVAV